MKSDELYTLAEELWPIYRTILGPGFKESLKIIKDFGLNNLRTIEFATGQIMGDWTIPNEYSVNDAYIIAPNGNRICSFKENNLHLVAHSIPVNGKFSLSELQDHLYSLPDQPTAIPYVTSYYESNWGFCLTQLQRDDLIPGEYQVFIDSKLSPGSLTIGELVIPGKSEKEIFFSTYLCHPGMANNELSGPVVLSGLARDLAKRENLNFTYRFVFVPETIGSISYIHSKLDEIKEKTVAGFNITCIGDERNYSFLPSRNGKTLSDRVGLEVVASMSDSPCIYSWKDRGSDERQYCAPGVDLPVASLMRSKYWEYPEYHTSLDTLGSVVTPKGLAGGLEMLERVINVLENNYVIDSIFFGEPQLGKRNLYPNVSIKGNYENTRNLLNILSYADGMNSLLDIANILELKFDEVLKIYQVLDQNSLIKTLRLEAD